nr:protein hrb1 [Quercus suber]
MASGRIWQFSRMDGPVGKGTLVSNVSTKLEHFTVRTLVLRTISKLTLSGFLTHHPIVDRPLRIHMWDISRSNAEPRFMQCNCDDTSPVQHTSQTYPSQGLEVGRMATASGWRAITPEISRATITPLQVAAIPYNYLPMVAQVMPARSPSDAGFLQAMEGMQLDAQDPRHTLWYQAQYQPCATAAQPQIQHMMQAAQMYQYSPDVMTIPNYTCTPAGTPVNTTFGTVRMEARGVFVSGLNYKARTKDIEALFSRAGVVSRCELHKDGSTGKSKGSATIQYMTADDAQRAIESFDGNVFMGMRIHVRRDKEATAVRTPILQPKKPHEPIIVNGSQVC